MTKARTATTPRTQRSGTLTDVSRGERDFPSRLAQYLATDTPKSLTMLGDPALIHSEPVAVLSSVQCPGDVILKTFDLAQALRDAAIPVIGGFHSPMEREMLDILLRGTQPVIHCPARGLEGMRLPATWRAPLDRGRMLLLSPFEAKVRRPTANHAVLRNRLVAALSRAVIITYARPGGKLAPLISECSHWGKAVFFIESRANAHLAASGRPLDPLQAPEAFVITHDGAGGPQCAQARPSGNGR